jgi:hypothetical protein
VATPRSGRRCGVRSRNADENVDMTSADAQG